MVNKYQKGWKEQQKIKLDVLGIIISALKTKFTEEKKKYEDMEENV